MATTIGASGTNVHEVASGIYRISTPVPVNGVPGGFTFNQYLVVDDEVLLFHTGPRRLFPRSGTPSPACCRSSGFGGSGSPTSRPTNAGR